MGRFLPPLVVALITSFLGKMYWRDRKILTELNMAIQFVFETNCQSFWKWNDWRRKHPIGIILVKPPKPLFTSKFIKKFDPPELECSVQEIEKLRNEFSSRVFF